MVPRLSLQRGGECTVKHAMVGASGWNGESQRASKSWTTTEKWGAPRPPRSSAAPVLVSLAAS